jgi:hypothetical protein
MPGQPPTGYYIPNQGTLPPEQPKGSRKWIAPVVATTAAVVGLVVGLAVAGGGDKDDSSAPTTTSAPIETTVPVTAPPTDETTVPPTVPVTTLPTTEVPATLPPVTVPVTNAPITLPPATPPPTTPGINVSQADVEFLMNVALPTLEDLLEVNDRFLAALEAGDVVEATIISIEYWNMARTAERAGPNITVAQEWNTWLDLTEEALDIISDGLINMDEAMIMEGITVQDEATDWMINVLTPAIERLGTDPLS